MDLSKHGISSKRKRKNYFLCNISLKEMDPKISCKKHLHGINWSSGYQNYTELEKILRKIKAPETEFFAKVYEQSEILSGILKTKVANLDDYACPKIQSSIFKDED